jgi:hypothetical protein
MVRISAKAACYLSTVSHNGQFQRPLAAHRDAVSELVGEVIGNTIENLLRKRGVSSRKTGRADGIWTGV